MKTQLQINKLHLIGLFVCLITFPALAQWETVYDQIVTYDIIDCPTPQVCYSGGTGFVKSTDSGSTWTDVNYTVTNTIYYLHCTDANTCYIGENAGGGFMKTTDGGQTWLPMTASTAKLVQPLYFLTPQIVYSIAGADFDNYFYKSTDAGANWTQVTTDLPVLLQGGANYPYFLDESIGFCRWYDVGTKTMRIYRTTNGGINWTQVYEYGSQISWSNYKMFFVDTQTGFVHFDRHKIMKTTDGGQNWSEVINPYSNDGVGSIFGMDVYDANRIVVSLTSSGSLGFHILKSSDGGANWTDESINFAGDVAVLNNDTVLIAAGNIMRNTNMNLAEVTTLSGEPIGKVYPNPASDHLSVQLSVLADGLQLLNMQGQLVQSIPIQNGKATLNRDDLESGTYLFQILNENNIIGTGKVVLQ